MITRLKSFRCTAFLLVASILISTLQAADEATEKLTAVSQARSCVTDLIQVAENPTPALDGNHQIEKSRPDSLIQTENPALTLEVLNGKVDSMPADLMMHTYLMDQAMALLQSQRQQILQLRHAEDIHQWQAKMRTWLVQVIGGLPSQHTPLNARITGRLTRPGYRVEKVLLQSQPGVYVTAVLFLPDSSLYPPPYPAVLVACGHTQNGKGFEAYQRGAALLAINGIAALMFDAIDHGERLQWRPPEGQSRLWGTRAHNAFGIGCMLLGTNIAQFMVYDALRCLDYLQSRVDIDGQRLGMAGQSGGGTQTAQVMSIDDRVKAAAPSCYITDLAHWLALIRDRNDVPADAEQNIAGQLRAGLNHWGFLLMRAPMPTLVAAAEQDFFPISGTRAAMEVASTIYERLGAADHIALSVDPGKHSWHRSHREATASWILRWLAGKNLTVSEPDSLPVLSDAEIQVTPTGQVLDLEGARSVYDVNHERLLSLREHRRALWAEKGSKKVLKMVRRITGIRRPAELPKPKIEIIGTTAFAGYCLQKWIITPDKGIVLPSLAFIPDNKIKNVVLWLDEQGKSSADTASAVKKALQQGQAVLAVDLRGLGETRSIANPWYGLEDAYVVLSYMLGRSYTAMRSEDILAAASAARRFFKLKTKITLIARGNQVSIPALHAAALERSLFGQVILKDDLISYESLVTDPYLASRNLVHVVPAALTVYDLTDLRVLL